MNKMLQPKIFIQAKDNNKDMQNLSPATWEKLTGKEAVKIRRDWRLRKERGYTNRQCVGLDMTPLMKDEKPQKQNTVLAANAFLRRKLL